MNICSICRHLCLPAFRFCFDTGFDDADDGQAEAIWHFLAGAEDAVRWRWSASEVVVVEVGDFGFEDFAGAGGAVFEVDAAVDVGGLAGVAGDGGFLLGWTSSTRTEISWPIMAAFLAKTIFCWASMISSLRRVRRFWPRRRWWRARRPTEGAGLGEKFKDADVFEAEVGDEFEEFFVLGFGFGGEAGDEGGAEGDAGDPGS